MKVTIVLVNGNSFGAGKDTTCDFIAQHIKKKDRFIAVHCYRFADKLKKWASDMTGIDRKLMQYNHYDNLVYDFTQQQKEIYCDLWGMTLGQLLQKFATEGCRDGFDDRIWVKLLSRDICREINFAADDISTTEMVFLIPDFRFKNEESLSELIDADIARQVTIKIVREEIDPEHKSRDIDHRGETELKDKDNWDGVILNNKSLHELNDTCAYIVDQTILPD